VKTPIPGFTSRIKLASVELKAFFLQKNLHKFAPIKKIKNMRKILFITLLFISAGIMNVSAQKGFNIGIGANYNGTFIINQNIYGGSPELDYKRTTSFAYNLQLGYNFFNWLGIKAEVGMTPMGQSYYNHDDIPSITRDVKLSYVTVPVMAHFSFGGKVFRFYANAGPQFAFLTKATQEYLKNGQPLPKFYNPVTKDSIDVAKTDIKDRYQSMDIMARIDIGLDIIIINHIGINVGLSGAYGLTDINASDWRLKNSSGEYKPSHNAYGGINFGLRYCF